MSELLEAALTGDIIKAFYRVYDRLGYGFLESVYAAALAYELEKMDIPFEREVLIDVYYEGRVVGRYRADFVVDGKVILENKSTRKIDEADQRQLLNYIRGSSLEIALLLHFGPKPTFYRFVYENSRKRELEILVNV